MSQIALMPWRIDPLRKVLGWLRPGKLELRQLAEQYKHTDEPYVEKNRWTDLTKNTCSLPFYHYDSDSNVRRHTYVQ